MSTNKKEFAPSVGFWPAKSGNGYTTFIDKKVIEELSKAEEGGRLYLQEVTNGKGNEKAPAYRVTIFPPSEQTKTNTDSI